MFRDRIPVAVARIVEKLRSLQWEVLVACSLSERFAGLLTGNPALAYLWVSHCKERGYCQDGAIEVLGAQLVRGGETNQRQLLRHLNLRSTKGALRLLRKCHLPALRSDHVELLRTVLRDDRRMERLRHLPRLGTGILELARSTRILQSCSPAMLAEIAATPEELHRARTAARIESHLALLDELGMPLSRPFRSREDLHRQHRELTNGFHELRCQLESSVLPPPAP
ncbi:MAG: hypothetical protein GWO24_34445, partial [Akkermansiaceae bacterium]|nr:hypothetical protein [Akkermansiaceae bacterium]